MGATAPASAREALDMVRAGLGYLAAADAARLPAATQAQVLRELEQTDAMAAAARAGFLAAFTAGAGPAGDGDYSAVSWLIHRTGITRGAAVGHSAWARRTATHPRVLAALAAGQVSESVGRVICLWTGKLPQEHRDQGDEQLLAAFAAGLGLGDLASLFAEMYVRARGDLPDQDPGREFADREVKLATTLGGAGVMHGDLTAECAAAVAAVLDALAAPAGKEDDRTKGQRYHDALAEAMRRLTAANLVPERAGQPVKAWVHIALADLLLLDGDSALQQEWTEQVRARWAARRAQASETGANDGAWLDGDYSAVSWLIHRTGITRGAAVGHTAWAKRAATHPRVIAALAAGQVSESAGRLICLWTGKLPQEYRDAGDEQLLAAFAAGLGLGDLASLFAEMFVRARGDLPDQDRGREFADREVKLATTIGGAGVVHGDLTAECAAAVAAVLDALAAPAGKEDDRTKGQRYHDALQEAMRLL